MASEPQADPDRADEPPVASAARVRGESAQRLQVGLFGLAAMILLVSLANIIGDQLRETEAGTVNDPPAATTGEGPSPADPLADAGVVPDIPATPTPTATPGATASDVPAPQP
jgi:hypothetical protein